MLLCSRVSDPAQQQQHSSSTSYEELEHGVIEQDRVHAVI
jgi:hypothetical protein